MSLISICGRLFWFNLQRNVIIILTNNNMMLISGSFYNADTAQKKKFFVTYFFSKCDQTRSFLLIWSHLLKKSVMENFVFCAVETH